MAGATRRHGGWRQGREMTGTPICGRKRRRDEGMTLIEVLMAALILAVVVFGAVAFMMSGRSTVERAGKERMAVEIASERLERARAGGYDAIAAGEDEIVVDGTTYTWTLAVSEVRADPADPGSLCKHVEVTVDWPTSQGRAVVLRTAVSP